MPTEHVNITDPELHEPKGVGTATADQVYVSDGAGSGAWTDIQDAVFPVADSYWEDLRFPATAINPPGGVNDADVDTDNGTFLFNASTAEVISIVAQIPHNWKSGTNVVPHVHWCKTTSAAGDVRWELEYKVYKIGEVGSASWTTLATVNTPVAGTPDNDTAEEHLITSFGDFDMTDFNLSDIIIFRVKRDAADASDTYGDDARLLEFDIHYQIDDLGSAAEFSG